MEEDFALSVEEAKALEAEADQLIQEVPVGEDLAVEEEDYKEESFQEPSQREKPQINQETPEEVVENSEIKRKTTFISQVYDMQVERQPEQEQKKIEERQENTPKPLIKQLTQPFEDRKIQNQQELEQQSLIAGLEQELTQLKLVLANKESQILEMKEKLESRAQSQQKEALNAPQNSAVIDYDFWQITPDDPNQYLHLEDIAAKRDLWIVSMGKQTPVIKKKSRPHFKQNALTQSQVVTRKMESSLRRSKIQGK